MPPPARSIDRPRSALWLWGFWVYAAAAFVAFTLSLRVAAPMDRVLRGVAGALFIAGGIHQARVVAYKRATRPAYSTFGPDAYLIDRQTGWSAIILGVVLVGSAWVAF